MKKAIMPKIVILFFLFIMVLFIVFAIPKFFPEDTQTAINKSNIYQYDSVQISTNAEDTTEIIMVIFSWNSTVNGIWINVSNTSVLIGQVGVNYTVNLTVDLFPGIVVGYLFHANDSGNSWNTTILKTFLVGGVVWNQSGINLSGNVGSLGQDYNVEIIGYLNNTNVNVSCYQGDCGKIGNNFTLQDINNSVASVAFNCSASSLGIFYANFSVNSTEDIYKENISVKCNITDTGAPAWQNPEINDTGIEQFDFVRFNATWTDNLNLSAYIFSINVTGIWVNVSNYTFSGTANESNFTMQINDSPYTVVGWIFYANDSFNSFNVTDVQTFVVVSQYHIFYGGIYSDIVLDNSQNLSIIAWFNSSNVKGNIYVSDTDTLNSISWTSLQAIGKDKSLNDIQNDWEDIDISLGTTQFNDSINRTFTFDGQPKNKTDLVVLGRLVENISTINSTNTSNFVTGILWDTSDSADTQYDTTEREDLVFITKVNNKDLGFYGTYNYEIKVPARLKQYRVPNDQDSISFYVELT